MLGKEFSREGSDIRLGGKIFIALVVDNMDRKGIERVKVRIIGVHDMDNTHKKNAIWAHHLSFSKFQSGEIPDVGDYLYITFMDPEDPMSALWIGFVRSNFGTNPL